MRSSLYAANTNITDCGQSVIFEAVIFATERIMTKIALLGNEGKRLLIKDVYYIHDLL
ncbi:hypothetical protein PSI19_12050 [Xenorhabdus khoisanae]|nr:hypothetical protein [Xenorhabdus khoisanae]